MPPVSLTDILFEEAQRPAVRQFRRTLASTFSHLGCKTVIFAGIIIEDDSWMVIKSRVDSSLLCRIDEAVVSCDVKH